MFAITYRLSGLLLASFATDRVISGAMNFALNLSMVFHSHRRVWPAVVNYYLLVVALGTAAYCSIRALADLGFNVIAAKILTETVLFLASFAVQRDFIFARSPSDPA